ncbi:MAG: methyltransferase family protein [Rubrimonas sp.]|uniref:methyltransferase family protein n=1 Tax=Rubrimonas sp. TaxID=2036015 RepID=UPI002FDE6536
MRLLRHVDLPPVWFALFAALIEGWSRAVSILTAPGWVEALGWAAMAAGLGLAGWAAVFFLTLRTPIEPRHTPRVLITAGPYRISRNPIYRGLILCLIGFALLRPELTGLVFVPLYAALLIRRFALPEQAVLADRFGPEFDAWRRRTPSLI